MRPKTLGLGETMHVRLPKKIDEAIREEAYKKSMATSVLLRTLVIAHFENRGLSWGKEKKAKINEIK